MKVGMWCCYVVGRPPAKFHRIRSSFDSPTDNYSDIIAGLTSDVFGLRKQSPSLSHFSSLSPKLSAQSSINRQAPKPLLARCIDPLTCASESCPEPDPGSRHRWVQIIPKHLQNVSVLLIGLPNIFFSTTRLRSKGRGSPYPNNHMLYIF